MTTIVFETHSWSEDNDRGIATGWHHGRLSEKGRTLARELGERRRDDRLAAVLVSDLGRAVETAEVAFAGSDVPILLDWRLRECDYGELNGHPVAVVHGSVTGVDDRYPGGETWREAVERCGDALAGIARRWDGGRVLVIGHMAAYWALEHLTGSIAVDDVLDARFEWREGWEFDVAPAGAGKSR